MSVIDRPDGVIDLTGGDRGGDVARSSGTTVVQRSPSTVEPVRRRIRGRSTEQTRALLGALATSISVTFLLFGRIAPFSGLIAFVVVAYTVFAVSYTVIILQSEQGPSVVDALVTILLYSLFLGVVLALGSVMVYTVVRGAAALRHLNFFTQDLHSTSPLAGLNTGGIKHAIIGTLWTVGIALAIAIPIGISSAVYLNESRSRFANLVRTAVNAMTALPDILAGLFIYAFWIETLHRQKSGLAAGLALTIMAVPIIIRASDVVLRLAPGNLKEASAALGAPRWRTAWHVTLPTMRSGLTTAVILGCARTIGETAPILLTSGYTTYANSDPVHGPMVSLPLLAFTLVGSGLKPQITRGFGAATVLLLLVVLLFVLARTVFGRPVGQQSRLSRRRIATPEARRSAAVGTTGATGIAVAAPQPPGTTPPPDHLPPPKETTRP